MIKIHALLLSALLVTGSVAMYADNNCRPTKTNQAAHHAAKMTECTAQIKAAEHELNRTIHEHNKATEKLEARKQDVRHAEHQLKLAKHNLTDVENAHSTLPSYANDNRIPTKTNQAAHHAAKMTECTAQIQAAEHKLNHAIHEHNNAVENLEKAKQQVHHAERQLKLAKYKLTDVENAHATLPSY